MNNSIAITENEPGKLNSQAEDNQKELTPDEQADQVINTMIAGMVGTAVVPVLVSLPIVMTAMGSGVVAIGRCYGTELNRDEAWHLIKQFIHAAGFCFIGCAVGSRVLSMILTATGAGYFAAVTMDAAISASLAYAIGACAKAYFKGERNKKVLGNTMRNKFKLKRSEVEKQKH